LKSLRPSRPPSPRWSARPRPPSPFAPAGCHGAKPSRARAPPCSLPLCSLQILIDSSSCTRSLSPSPGLDCLIGRSSRDAERWT